MSAVPGRPPASGVDEFVGRDRELDDLRPLVRRRRLVTLTGPAGVGKTRLAVELIPLVQRSYRGALWWVELAPLPAESAATAAVAAALRARGERGHDLVDRVRKACEDGLALLVLDNCEHVVHDCAKLAERLLAACPRLRILTTSREQLGVPGEVLFPVLPLHVAGPQDATEKEILRSDAVRLFVARAGEAAPAVAWDGAMPVLAALCARLDGLPLAIELAARQVNLQPPQQLLDRLDERLATLTAAAAAQPRHRSLRAAIEWSYSLSTGVEQAAFRRLAVLPGGFADNGAAALCADLRLAADELWAVLTGLVSKSLLAVDTVVPGRFRMLESLRVFGREQLVGCGELAAAHARLLAWLTDLTPPSPLEGTGYCDRLAVLRREHHNLRYAVQVARDDDDPRYPRLALDLADDLVSASELRQADEILEGALARCPGCAERIQALSELGAVKVALGEPVDGRRYAREAATLARTLDEPALTARAVGVLSIAVQDDDPAEAARLSAEKVEIVRRIGDRRQIGLSLNNLAWHLMVTGRYDEAGATLDEALSWLDPQRDSAVVTAGRHTGGTLALLCADVDGAAARYGEALNDTKPGDKAFRYLLAGVALVADRRDQPERALRLLGAAAKASHDKSVAERWWHELLADAEERGRDRLGARRAVAALAAGAALTAEQAFEYAVSDSWPGTPGDGAGPALTPREQQVAELVAQGLTDRQIAVRLGLSPRTVTSHLAHIRTKLDLPNRTQVTVWATRRSPH